MKMCGKCGTEKSPRRSGPKTYCRVCQAANSKRWRETHPDRAKEIDRAWHERHPAYRRPLVAFVIEAKAQPCMDCGGRFPSCAMDFDHRDPSSKVAAVAAMASGAYNLEQVLAEIAKCDLVCANCHRIRTWIERAVA